ncbi:MAG: leucine-rich repeat protein [Harvfovirus sp.]|uniref:Leucine-rich repeat protein n=1 Tax=Harvfovirus sp. TaxID=2487768 RepID=A0A3G5A432_9VIRU|nr:MAG: leucine-rich repeat protein [Harvfovirus sp.]
MEAKELYAAAMLDIKKWKDLVSDALNMDNDSIDELASKMVAQVKTDDSSGNISTCVFAFPHINYVHDRKTKLAHKICFNLFPPANVEIREERMNSYVLYSQFIGKLKARLLPLEEEAKKKAWETDEYGIARGGKQKKLWCELKTRRISDHITEPKPMPVTTSDEADFKEFLDYLKENKQVSEEKEFKRGIFYPDGRIDLCKQVIPKLSGLMSSIKDNKYVEHFLLGNNIVGVAGMKDISDHIKDPSVSKIKTWYLAGNNIDHLGMKLLVEGLRDDCVCSSLWLKRNPLGPTGAKEICELLRVNKTIEILDLQNTGLLDEGVKFVFEGLRENKTLKHLYLDANGITEVGAQYIADYFLTCDNLESLWLEMNRLGDKGAIILANSLKNNKKLERLSVGSNRIENVGIKAFCDVFASHPKLFMFYCGMHKATKDVNELCNRIGNEGLMHIISLLRLNPRIQLLNISHNGIDEAGLELFSKNIGELVNVEYEQYDIQPTKQIRSRINFEINANCMKYFGEDYGECLKNRFRVMKHTEKIKYIDSNYRNNA